MTENNFELNIENTPTEYQVTMPDNFARILMKTRGKDGRYHSMLQEEGRAKAQEEWQKFLGHVGPASFDQLKDAVRDFKANGKELYKAKDKNQERDYISLIGKSFDARIKNMERAGIDQQISSSASPWHGKEIPLPTIYAAKVEINKAARKVPKDERKDYKFACEFRIAHELEKESTADISAIAKSEVSRWKKERRGYEQIKAEDIEEISENISIGQRVFERKQKQLAKQFVPLVKDTKERFTRAQKRIAATVGAAVTTAAAIAIALHVRSANDSRPAMIEDFSALVGSPTHIAMEPTATEFYLSPTMEAALTATDEPTPTPTLIIPTSTLPFTATSTETLVPTSTKTPKPSATSTNTPTLTYTPSATLRPTETATTTPTFVPSATITPSYTPTENPTLVPTEIAKVPSPEPAVFKDHETNSSFAHVAINFSPKTNYGGAYAENPPLSYSVNKPETPLNISNAFALDFKDGEIIQMTNNSQFAVNVVKLYYPNWTDAQIVNHIRNFDFVTHSALDTYMLEERSGSQATTPLEVYTNGRVGFSCAAIESNSLTEVSTDILLEEFLQSHQYDNVAQEMYNTGYLYEVAGIEFPEQLNEELTGGTLRAFLEIIQQKYKYDNGIFGNSYVPNVGGNLVNTTGDVSSKVTVNQGFDSLADFIKYFTGKNYSAEELMDSKNIRSINEEFRNQYGAQFPNANIWDVAGLKRESQTGNAAHSLNIEPLVIFEGTDNQYVLHQNPNVPMVVAMAQE